MRWGAMWWWTSKRTWSGRLLAGIQGVVMIGGLFKETRAARFQLVHLLLYTPICSGKEKSNVISLDVVSRNNLVHGINLPCIIPRQTANTMGNSTWPVRLDSASPCGSTRCFLNPIQRHHHPAVYQPLVRHLGDWGRFREVVASNNQSDPVDFFYLINGLIGTPGIKVLKSILCKWLYWPPGPI